jgi:hypothetical protein
MSPPLVVLISREVSEMLPDQAGAGNRSVIPWLPTLYPRTGRRCCGHGRHRRRTR